MRMQGKVALVTGGVSGIGKAIAFAFAREGAAVVVNYSKSQDEAETTMVELADMGANALLIQADVARDAQVRMAIKQVLDTFGRLDVLVNNAGVTHSVRMTDLEGLTEDIWDLIYSVNVKGAFFCARAVSLAMKMQGEGCIINIASVSGIIGRGSSIAYAASKAAVISLTKSLAIALAPEVRVNAIAPGFVPTRWHAGHESWHASIIQETPLRRLAQPDDIARLALALATDASFVTGQTIVCDGGSTL